MLAWLIEPAESREGEEAPGARGNTQKAGTKEGEQRDMLVVEKAYTRGSIDVACS